MAEWLNQFVMAFIPLFVAIDPIGMAGMFVGLTEDVAEAERSRTAKHAAVTALVVGLGFMAIGRFLFQAIGITIGDFQMAGGLILLIVASRSLLDYERKATPLSEDFGVVPLGLPLIAGPAMLSALLVLQDTAGVGPTIAALVVNMFLTWFSMRHVKAVMRVMGKRGVRAVSKIISLLLVAFAVHMIRVGWQRVMDGAVT
ncbi:MarC family protein [Desulfohalovibrio reitneri]|uniref:MarC family protein n=1 Tax=Desulfohalovibrio reitneri TaxID=1307759 RepID=UPI0004A786DF|nr:MarC family protein [Desulfohalovibrio reitneri]